MLFINLTSTNPYFNLACEEFLLENFTEDIFMLWQNDNTVVIGRNQNTLSEINYDYVKENDICVVRRMSGGGAVYHDKGNVNFTFIKSADGLFSDYKTFTKPIIDFLNTLGADAVLSGRNDILIDGKKISGNAQFTKCGRILHHGTLLFSSSSDVISKVLNVSEEKIKSKGVKSVKSRVTNISEHINLPIDSREFKERLASFVVKNYENCQEYDIQGLTDKINELSRKKYETWEWNFGYSPKYDFCEKKRFPFGSVEVNLHIEDGIIKNAKIYGDFFSKKNVDEFCAKLSGAKHKKEEIEQKLLNVNTDDYISGMNKSDFLELLF